MPSVIVAAAVGLLAVAAPAAASRIYYGCGHNICIVRPDGSHRHRITHGGHYENPRIVRRTLAFVYRDRPYLADRNAHHRRLVPYNKRQGFPLTPILRRDGRRAFYFTGFYGTGARLCTVSTARGAKPYCPDGVSAERDYWAWGPHGSLITTEYFDGQGRDGDDICIMADRYRCKKVLVTLDNGDVFNGAPELSPNGRQLAVGADDLGQRGNHIVLFDLRTRRLVRNLTGGPSDSQPSWSPDGRAIVFQRSWVDRHGTDRTSICTTPVRRRHIRCQVRRVAGYVIGLPTWGP